jgi:hypothetical protein
MQIQMIPHQGKIVSTVPVEVETEGQEMENMDSRMVQKTIESTSLIITKQLM